MAKEWESPRELAIAIKEKAGTGKNVLLSPETALAVAHLVDNQIADPAARFRVGLYSAGSTVYRLDARGEIAEAVAFARNSLVARAAFDYLCEHYPDDSFSQRRGAWVEADRLR